jgi:hypothetical protein
MGLFDKLFGGKKKHSGYTVDQYQELVAQITQLGRSTPEGKKQAIPLLTEVCAVARHVFGATHVKYAGWLYAPAWTYTSRGQDWDILE